MRNNNMRINSKRSNKRKRTKLILAGVALVLLIAIVVVVILVAKSCSPDTPPATDDDFIPVENEIMYAYYDHDSDGVCDEGANIFLRAEPSNDGEIKHTLHRGTQVIRIAVCYDNGTDGHGWSKVVYEEETYYTRNSCLSPTNPGPGSTSSDTSADTTTAD